MDVSSLGTDIQSIREIDDSGCTLISEIDTMMANMTGSSILKRYWPYWSGEDCKFVS